MNKKKKIGRNDPCPCGSGKKYKKCCLSLDETRKTVPKELIERISKHQEEEKKREEKYGKVKQIIHTDFHGYKIVGVGNRLHYQKNCRTFPDFLIPFVGSELGKDWGNAEIKKPFEDRHEILKWYDGLCRFQRKQTKRPNGLYCASPNGVSAAYLLLAYDLYIIRHHMAIKEEIVKRLKDPDQFQGARYELFAVATCIRAGFEIEYENERDGSMKHAEFIATHKATGQKLLVEAKSKHRKGILGQPGNRIPDDKIRTRFGELLNQAILKRGGYPLVIFIDVNLPPDRAKGFLEIPPPKNPLSRLLDQQIEKSDSGKDLFNLLLFTNNPHHYGRDDEIDPARNNLAIFSKNPEIVVEHPDVLSELCKAVQKYGNVPNEFPDN